MFSQFPKANAPYKTNDLSLSSLVKLIKNHPQKDLIDSIRVRKVEGDMTYRNDKNKIISFSPNCVVKSSRKFETEEDFRGNFASGSGYIYFDIDGVADAQATKAEFIAKYAEIVSLVAVSSSLGGLSILVKIDRNISSREEFVAVWQYFVDNIFTDYKIDGSTKNIGRINFITSDPQVFVNYENEFCVPDMSLPSVRIKGSKKGSDQCTNHTLPDNTLTQPFIEISALLTQIKTETYVEVEGELFDIKPVEYAKIYIPRVIADGAKRKTFSQMIHQLVFINPEITRHQIMSFLNYVNSVFAKPRMDIKELSKLVDFVLNYINEAGVKAITRQKNVHIKKGIMTKPERIQLANSLNGKIRQSRSIQKISEARQELSEAGSKITKVAVSELSGLSLSTIKNLWDIEDNGLEAILTELEAAQELTTDSEPIGLGVCTLEEMEVLNEEEMEVIAEYERLAEKNRKRKEEALMFERRHYAA